MNLEEILLGGGGVLLTAMTLIQVAPIKVNPWSAVAKAIGRAINGEVIAKVDQLERDLKDMKADQEELSACGMDGASLLTVSLTSGETFTLAIGGQTEDGSYVYAALEAPAPGCDLFLISADKARTLSDLNYESLSANEEAE